MEDSNKKLMLDIKKKQTHFESIEEEKVDADEDDESPVDPKEIFVQDKTDPASEVLQLMSRFQLRRQGGGMPEGDSTTGELIKKIKEYYLTAEKRPRLRGNVKCYCYINNEPLFVIGPGFKRSILIFFAVTIGVGVGIDYLDHSTWAFHVMYVTLLLWIITTLYLILMNPGLAPLDPSIHSNGYLEELKLKNVITRLCMTCKCIERADAPFRKSAISKSVDHCLICNVCVEGHD